jgi:hypothetical protein
MRDGESLRIMCATNKGLVSGAWEQKTAGFPAPELACSSLLPLITHTPYIPPSTLSTLWYLKTQILQPHKSIREFFFS